MLLDLADERHEQRPVEAAGVEVRRGDIGGRHHHHAEFEQPREQPPQDHRIGDVGDVELVEAQKPGVLGQRGRREPDRILVADAPGLDLGPEPPDPVVDVRHELVEMDPPLALHREASKNRSIIMVLPRPTSPWT